MPTPALQAWHRIVKEDDWDALEQLIAEDAVFHSPVVHTPQVGRTLVLLYLRGAAKVVRHSNFRYVREIASDTAAMLEFEAEIDGIHINGIDLISWNRKQQITDFKVLVRPLKGVNMLHQKMREQLEAMQAGRV